MLNIYVELLALPFWANRNQWVIRNINETGNTKLGLGFIIVYATKNENIWVWTSLLDDAACLTIFIGDVRAFHNEHYTNLGERDRKPTNPSKTNQTRLILRFVSDALSQFLFLSLTHTLVNIIPSIEFYLIYRSLRYISLSIEIFFCRHYLSSFLHCDNDIRCWTLYYSWS